MTSDTTAPGTHLDEVSPEAPTTQTGRITTAVLNRMYVRALSIEASFNYERQQGLGFAYSMIPAVRALYEKESDQAAALKKHLEFFNTTPYVAGAIVGVSTAVEEQLSQDPSLAPSTANSVKAALMGPLAGIGDSLYWGTIRLLVTGIGVSLAMAGNILGPIIFLLGFNLPVQLLSYLYLRSGYRFGTKLLQRISGSDAMSSLTYGAGIVGLMVIGGLTASMVSVYVPLQFEVGEGVSSIQTDVLDGIMPGILGLGAFWLVYWLLGKGWKTTWVLLAIFAVGLLGALTGVLGTAP
ncbi:PTS system mannose/fructose/sorbose family transporter subunit IID [Pseudoclavibacter terrae]|uniref:PTS system mannose/fructose/sorbose family transporter subunit IID n=1 Tax=Pseudoclavibacter terrae TaxID=1530195 RepID=A0A7J5B161_9MICO|nr:PTS system mannose/fructose/sorbose family transporter subunit IID [Pseudoclavibacter terrae]KAB1637610.1 PTS system mannose/fructose/sorbose family transporter subunit IID [Pseudoclavibacter terrae]